MAGGFGTRRGIGNWFEVSVVKWEEIVGSDEGESQLVCLVSMDCWILKLEDLGGGRGENEEKGRDGHDGDRTHAEDSAPMEVRLNLLQLHRHHHRQLPTKRSERWVCDVQISAVDLVGTAIGTRTAYTLARTCRAFLEPALDVLWSEQHDFRFLASCMPDGLWEIREIDNKNYLVIRSFLTL